MAATADEATSEHAVHVALDGEFGLVSRPAPPGGARKLEQALVQRRAILRALLRAEGAAARWCPLQNAAHYRLLSSMRLILRSLSPTELHENLTEVDVYGQTVLHAVSAAKASGLARRVLLDGGTGAEDYASLAAVGRHIGVALPLPAPRRLSVRALNDAIEQADLELLLEAAATAQPPLLGGDAAWLDAADGRGRTALHLACRAGRARTVAVLLRSGAAPLATEDEWRGTCGHLAAARGHLDALGEWLQHAGGEGEGGGLEMRDGFGRSVRALRDGEAGGGGDDGEGGGDGDGDEGGVDESGGDGSCDASADPTGGADGWRRPAQRLLLGLDAPGAAFVRRPAGRVAVVDAARLSRSEFVRRFESVGRPVLLRNASRGWPALSGPRRWTRARLLEVAGSVPVAASSMPYQPPASAAAAHATLADFLHSMRTDDAPPNASAPRPFVFDAGRLLHQPSLAQDIGEYPALLEVERGGAVLNQLSISPALAGAHPHFHGQVLNALVVGRRRWALVPPVHAEFTLRPAIEHFSRLRWGGGGGADGDGDGGGAAAAWLDATQLPGDVLYVPPQWEHATLSLEESVGVAVEFV